MWTSLPSRRAATTVRSKSARHGAPNPPTTTSVTGPIGSIRVWIRIISPPQVCGDTAAATTAVRREPSMPSGIRRLAGLGKVSGEAQDAAPDRDGDRVRPVGGLEFLEQVL